MHYTSNKNTGSKHKEIGFFVISLLLHLQTYGAAASLFSGQTRELLTTCKTMELRTGHLTICCAGVLKFQPKLQTSLNQLWGTFFCFCMSFSAGITVTGIHLFYCSCSALSGEQLCELQESSHKPFKVVGGVTWHLPHLHRSKWPLSMSVNSNAHRKKGPQVWFDFS